jgi:hypothetical protein
MVGLFTSRAFLGMRLISLNARISSLFPGHDMLIDRVMNTYSENHHGLSLDNLRNLPNHSMLIYHTVT